MLIMMFKYWLVWTRSKEIILQLKVIKPGEPSFAALKSLSQISVKSCYLEIPTKKDKHVESES